MHAAFHVWMSLCACKRIVPAPFPAYCCVRASLRSTELLDTGSGDAQRAMFVSWISLCEGSAGGVMLGLTCTAPVLRALCCAIA